MSVLIYPVLRGVVYKWVWVVVYWNVCSSSPVGIPIRIPSWSRVLVADSRVPLTVRPTNVVSVGTVRRRPNLAPFLNVSLRTRRGVPEHTETHVTSLAWCCLENGWFSVAPPFTTALRYSRFVTVLSCSIILNSTRVFANRQNLL
jgi:hypothetical protein